MKDSNYLEPNILNRASTPDSICAEVGTRGKVNSEVTVAVIRGRGSGWHHGFV